MTRLAILATTSPPRRILEAGTDAHLTGSPA
jgi:hypothetical protein